MNGAGLLSRLSLTALLLAAADSASALDVPPLQARVNDLASVLTPGQRDALEQKLAAHEQQTGQQFALLTVPSLEGQAIDDFGIRVAEKWKLGSEKADGGLVLIVAPNDRAMRIEVGYGLEGTIPDAIAARVIREVLSPAFRAGDFAGGINSAFDALIGHGSGEAPLPAAAPAKERQRRKGSLFGLLSPLILPLILFFLFSSFGGGRRRRGGFFAGPFIGGGGWGGGGGFSSGGGGGGFSGGGGGFGGGGASGNW